MRKISILLLLVLICSLLGAQNVTNADAEQEGKTIHITYTLDKPAEIKVFVSTDGGRTYESNPLTAVSGDVGKGVTPGNKTIIWDVLSERDKFVFENAVFKVTASNGIYVEKKNNLNLEMVYVEGGTFTMGCMNIHRI